MIKIPCVYKRNLWWSEKWKLRNLMGQNSFPVLWRPSAANVQRVRIAYRGGFRIWEMWYRSYFSSLVCTCSLTFLAQWMVTVSYKVAPLLIVTYTKLFIQIAGLFDVRHCTSQKRYILEYTNFMLCHMTQQCYRVMCCVHTYVHTVASSTHPQSLQSTWEILVLIYAPIIKLV